MAREDNHIEYYIKIINFISETKMDFINPKHVLHIILFFDQKELHIKIVRNLWKKWG